MQPRRAWKFSRNHNFASHVKDMSSAQRKWAPTSRWILEFFPVSCLSYSTVLLNCFLFVSCFLLRKVSRSSGCLPIWLPYTVASVPYGTHISVFASSLTSTQSQSEPVSGGATGQDSDISQRMSSPRLLSVPELLLN